VEEGQSLKHLNQDLPDGVDVEPFVVLALYEAVQIEAEHFGHDADVAPEFEVPLNLDDIFVGRGVVADNLQDFDF
jgi:hypothetical protein